MSNNAFISSELQEMFSPSRLFSIFSSISSSSKRNHWGREITVGFVETGADALDDELEPFLPFSFSLAIILLIVNASEIALQAIVELLGEVSALLNSFENIGNKANLPEIDVVSKRWNWASIGRGSWPTEMGYLQDLNLWSVSVIIPSDDTHVLKTMSSSSVADFEWKNLG